MAAIPGPTDSYSSLERHLKARTQRALAYLLAPAVALLGLGPAIKTYLVFYPALIAYLGWGVNLLTPALALATLAMAAGIGVSLWRLHSIVE